MVFSVLDWGRWGLGRKAQKAAPTCRDRKECKGLVIVGEVVLEDDGVVGLEDGSEVLVGLLSGVEKNNMFWWDSCALESLCERSGSFVVYEEVEIESGAHFLAEFIVYCLCFISEFDESGGKIYFSSFCFGVSEN